MPWASAMIAMMMIVKKTCASLDVPITSPLRARLVRTRTLHFQVTEEKTHMNLSHPARALALAMVMGGSVALAACGGSEPEPAAAPTEAVIEAPVELPTIEVIMPTVEISATDGITTTTEMTSTTEMTTTTSTTTTTTITDTGVVTP